MKKRVSDIVADFLYERGITDVFCLVGGGSMFLNNALGFRKEIKVTYCQHEQACAMAAEGYVRATGRMAAVCVTTGPGGTNAITGVLGAYQDNYPMLILSGQVRKPTGVESTGLPLRFMGEQEHDITGTVRNVTKYAKYVSAAEDIRYELGKACAIALDGRRGPVWLDIPMDIQSAVVETEELRRYIPEKDGSRWSHSQKKQFLKEIRKAERPLILAGSGIRSSCCVTKFRKLAHKLGIPVVVPTYNADIFVYGDPIYYGNFGIIGGRTGNFLIQNADLIVAIGCRMTFRQIGFNYEQFSPKSRRVVIDADQAELEKPTLRIDLPICADLRDIIEELLRDDEVKTGDISEWTAYADSLRERYPIYQERFEKHVDGQVNPYYFTKMLHRYLPVGYTLVLGNSTIAAHVLQLGIEHEEDRVINNMNCGSMGYDLPAAIGAAVGTDRMVTLITGDGSIMLNLQELMTAKHYNLPIKIFISCNGGYRGVVRSQSNMFDGKYTGCTPDTGVELPDFEKVAVAFGIPFIKINDADDLEEKLQQIYADDRLMVIEWPQDPEQTIEPRVVNRRDEKGTIISTPIDDLFPFLPKEEYEADRFETWRKEHTTEE